MKTKLHPSFRVLLCVGSSLPLLQAVELPNIFSSHMVLQRGVAAPVWGKAAPGAQVTVSFGGQTRTVTADGGGKWMVRFEPMAANAVPQTLTVTEGAQTVKFDDVLVGDNWLCSGQSNMEWDLNSSANPDQERAGVVNYPQIRFFRASEHLATPAPLDNAPGTWNTMTPESVRPLTAVGYFFARNVHEAVKVPVGIIQSAWGGSPIEPWVTPAGFRMVPELADYSQRVDRFDPSTPAGREMQKEIVGKVAAWLPGAREAAEAGRPMPAMPEWPKPDNSCTMYNGMIAPLVPFGIKGALWYQGESNGGEGISYFHKKQALIGGWRKAFGVGDFPFYFVQLANFQNPNPDPAGGDGWARVREAQLKSLEIPNTGMAVAIDLADAGNPGDIHPRNKQDVGARLAQWALHQTYGMKDVVPSGPLYKSAARAGNRLKVSFEWVGGGLMVGKKTGLEPVKEVAGGQLKGFAIAGADRKWVWADAVIEGNTVVLSHPEVAEPVAVRYAFSMNPDQANLYNRAGLPASPFRSDDW